VTLVCRQKTGGRGADRWTLRARARTTTEDLQKNGRLSPRRRLHAGGTTRANSKREGMMGPMKSTKKPANRIVRAVTRGLLERDRLQLRAVGALLSVVEPKKRHPKRPRRKRKAKQTR
jgi:hypothetical protein